MRKDNNTAQRQQIFLEALKKNLYVITAACEQTGIPRRTYYDWMKYDQEFKSKVEEVEEMQIEFAETQLLKKIKEGSEKAIIFFLRTKGRKKGYGENLSVDGSLDINKITFEVITKKDALEDEGTED